MGSKEQEDARQTREQEDIWRIEEMLKQFFDDNLDALIRDFSVRLIQGHNKKTFNFIMDGYDIFSQEYMEWMQIQLEIDRLRRIYGPVDRMELPKIEPKNLT